MNNHRTLNVHVFESFETVRFYTAILTFDVFFIENIDLFADFVSKIVINNKSVENQKCLFHRHFAEIK